MASANARRLAAVLTAGLCTVVFASSAAAATTTPFGCRASVARVTLLNAITTEPFVANTPTTPCATDTDGLNTASLPTTSNAAIVAGPVGVFTHSVFSSTGATPPGAAAIASIAGVTIPTSRGSIVIVGPVEANASYACVNNRLVAHSGSTLDVLYVNGTKTMLPAPGSPATIQLGGGSYIAVNERIQTSNSLTERVLDVHLAGLANLVLAEAEVTQSKADPCAGTSGPPPILDVCPPGSTLNVVAQVCEIVLPGKVIVVSLPFKGPSGGTVIALSVARKRYKSPCLHGSGPDYVLVATKRGGRVTGTPHSDRILGLGAYERIAGLGGDDCIDGIAGSQTIWDGNGKDRVYAGPGRNRIGLGGGNDYFDGRSGSDWVTSANGNDTIHGGRGNTRIDVGIGKDHVYGGPGKNRIFAAGASALVSCGSGRHNVAYLRPHAAKYARQHGCETIYFLK